MNYWFTSDTHFWHAGAIKHCRRPFASVDEMNAAMIERWNDRVRQPDIVFHLGDVSFGNRARTESVLSQLRGTIYIVPGNHDSINDLRARCSILPALHELKLESRPRIVLCHYALESWNKMHYGTWMLHGHSHGNLPPRGKRVDVGVDCFGYAPVHLDELTKIMDERVFVPVDHHVRPDAD